MKHCRHVVEFYGGDADRFVRNVAAYLAASLRAGGAAVAVASAEHRAAFGEAIAREGVEPSACGERLVMLDDESLLEELLVDGQPAAELIASKVVPLLARLCTAYSRLHVYGEMVGRLWARRAFDAANQLEQHWNQLLKRMQFDLYCGYPIDVLSEDFQIPAMRGILAAHGRLVPVLDERFDAAMRRAVNDVLGDHPFGRGRLVDGGFATLKTALPDAEETILRLRSALPRYADEILAKAKEYA